MVVDNEDVGGHKHHHAGSAMYDNITYVEKTWIDDCVHNDKELQPLMISAVYA